MYFFRWRRCKRTCLILNYVQRKIRNQCSWRLLWNWFCSHWVNSHCSQIPNWRISLKKNIWTCWCYSKLRQRARVLEGKQYCLGLSVVYSSLRNWDWVWRKSIDSCLPPWERITGSSCWWFEVLLIWQSSWMANSSRRTWENRQNWKENYWCYSQS